MKITIFYSWQSRTDETYNKEFIRDCIRAALKQIRKNKGKLKDVTFELQEGIDKIAGSPPVASTIMDKRIPNCNIFIADLTVTDSLSDREKFLQFFAGKKRQFHQANNVVIEYGIAYNAIGYNQIIGVLNSAYGSPSVNPDNIFFDIKSLRFPIDYKYSKKNEKESESEGLKLANALAVAIRACTVSAIESWESKYKPFISWSSHQKYKSIQNKFYKNEKIIEIQNEIINSKNDIRLLGLSGLGKTRIVFEAFRSDEEISLKYLYCDNYLSDEAAIMSAVEMIFYNGENCALIIDNCSLSLFRKIRLLKHEKGVTNSIISISNNPDEDRIDKADNICYISILINDLTSVVDQILVNSFTMLKPEEIVVIKDFSKGIPQMAVLLAESVKNGEKYIGRLEDKDLLSKLLSIDPSTNDRIILQSYSLFDYIGYEENLRSQMEFIATNKDITPLSGDDKVVIRQFDHVFNKYFQREIFEKNGRLVGLRPKPLALTLAVEWFNSCSSQTLMNVIESIQDPKNIHGKMLTESLCNQIRYLGYNDKANSVISKLVGTGFPFDNAEVVNTELGSRLFRSFVEVNPVAVAENLERNFGRMNKEELVKVEDGRRNLVWVLEKLCFDKDTFTKGAKLLMAFSVAENETWGNNSTNEFLHLFKIHLAGTQAKLEERLGIIKWGLGQGEDYKLISIKALNSALESRDFTRFMGAETQGTKILKDYVPTNNEILEYWSEVLEILENHIFPNGIYSDICRDIIAKNTRGLYRIGFGNFLLPVIKRISEKINNDWDSMLDRLYDVKKYDNKIVKRDDIQLVDELIELLTKKDFYSRYLAIEKKRNRIDDISFQESITLKQKDYYELANEFVVSEFCSKDILKNIYKNKQIFSAPFGSRIAELIEDDEEKLNAFILDSLDILSVLEIEIRNISVFIDFARGIKLDKTKVKIVNSILEKNSLLNMLFPLFGIFEKDEDELDILFSIVEDNQVSINEFIQYLNYYPHQKYTDIKFTNFCYRLNGYGKDGINTSLSILSNFLYHDSESNPNSIIYTVLEDTLRTIDISDPSSYNRDQYFQMVELLLTRTNNADFAKFLNLEMLKLARDWKYSFGYNYNLERTYSILLTKYFCVIWEDLSNALLSKEEDYIVFHQLQSLLGSHIGGVSNQVGLLFSGNIESIFDWCQTNPMEAPKRLALMVPIFEDQEFHPIAKRLINEYGDNQELLDNLSCNMGTYSWVGSVVPLLESKIKLLESLYNHPITRVAEWAQIKVTYLNDEIHKENQKEDERKFLYN